jgi:hypothetical protein
VSLTYIPVALRHQVWARAAGACEYCRIREDEVMSPHEPDHVIAEQHGGATTLENLALACVHCNRFKGPNVASVDPLTGVVVRLFHPRQDRWAHHFAFAGPRIEPATPGGRATAALLRLNAEAQLRLRAALIGGGRVFA